MGAEGKKKDIILKIDFNSRESPNGIRSGAQRPSNGGLIVINSQGHFSLKGPRRWAVLYKVSTFIPVE